MFMPWLNNGFKICHVSISEGYKLVLDACNPALNIHTGINGTTYTIRFCKAGVQQWGKLLKGNHRAKQEEKDENGIEIHIMGIGVGGDTGQDTKQKSKCLDYNLILKR